METSSFEVKIAKHKSIRITLTGSNIGRPRDYMYFVGAEDAKAYVCEGTWRQCKSIFKQGQKRKSFGCSWR